MDKINITANEANQRLDRFLRKYMANTALSDIYKLLRKKRITVNGQKSRENYRLEEGDTVEIYIDTGRKAVCDLEYADMDFSVIYEDKNILVADKPPGLILHPDIAHKGNTLVDQVLYYLYGKNEYNPEKAATFRPASVNRLDVNTGGLVIFSKNFTSLQNLNDMMRRRYIGKYYICVVKGSIAEEREISAYLAKNSQNNTVRIAYDEKHGDKPIRTRLIPLKTSKGYTLMEIELITGRSHQIRAQLADIGNPIIGDSKYGDMMVNRYFNKEYGLNGQLLYAYRMRFNRASAELAYLEGLSFNAGLPENYKAIIKSIFNMNME